MPNALHRGRPRGASAWMARGTFFPTRPPDFQNKAAGLAWKPLKVPSNYEMEGFTTKTDTAAYHKVVTIPQEWAGKRIRLRAEAIYSSCDVWLNGQRVGGHDGGATPFELDLSAAAKPGQPNDLCILVKARSKAAMIDNMSVYAYFEIAGIWRPLELFCVEPVHVARLTYATVFDKQYKDADLAVDVKVVNEQPKAVESNLALTVLDPAGKIVELKGLDATVSLGPWEAKTVTLKTQSDAADPVECGIAAYVHDRCQAGLGRAGFGEDRPAARLPSGGGQRACLHDQRQARPALWGLPARRRPVAGPRDHRRARSAGSGVDEGGKPQRHSHFALPAASHDARCWRTSWGCTSRTRGRRAGPTATRICETRRSTSELCRSMWNATAIIPRWSIGRPATRAITGSSFNWPIAM